jgi:uncharacterized membrane protein
LLPVPRSGLGGKAETVMNENEAVQAPGGTEHYRSKRKVIVLNVTSVLLGLFFASAGLLKLLDVPRLADAYSKMGAPRWVFFGSGIIELLAGAALAVPRFRATAVWTLLAMIFLVGWKPWAVHELFFLVPQVVTITLLVLLALSQRWLEGPGY